MRMKSELQALFAEVPLQTLETSDAVIYATDPELRLIYANPAWDRFAMGNNAPSLLRSGLPREPLLNSIRGPLRNFYGDLFGDAIRKSKPVEHQFVCPSASVQRRLHMRVLPLRDRGLLVMNSVEAEEPIEDSAALPERDEYLDSNRLISMCSHCRRTLRTDTGSWEWVPEFVENQPEEVSHGLCSVCLEYHHLSERRRRRAG